MSGSGLSAARYAPDHATRRLAAGLHWEEIGRSDRLAWGRCQGSAQHPYQVVAVLAESPRTHCTCPSRRTPCKHAFGLLVRWADDQLAVAPEPDFAREWEQRLAQAPTAPRTPADPEAAADAAAKRVAQRRERVSAGLDELERWLGDQVRNGLSGLARGGYAAVETVAARMVDAQAPGVANQLRSLPAEMVGEGWPERALHQLGGLHLLVQAHRRLDELPAGLAATVRSRIGYPVAKADVLARRAVADTWWALGCVDVVDYQLETRRVWLRGARTGRWALWLAFAPPGQPLDPSVLPGMVLPADLHFYPASGHRALLGHTYAWEPEPIDSRPEWTVAAARDDFAAELAGDPWASRSPALIHGTPLPPSAAGEPWRLRDMTGRTCALIDLDAEPWPLVAQSAGRPLTVFGEWSARGLRPLSVLADAEGRRFSMQVCG